MRGHTGALGVLLTAGFRAEILLCREKGKTFTTKDTKGARRMA